jgi:nitrogen regulatory protein P-II 2
MQTITLKKITIIAEALLEKTLLREIKALGATGYTITTARGEGSRGVRASDWEGGNIKLETLVSESTAHKILEQISSHYFEHHAVIAYIENVEVVRGEKYLGK